jgi:hypothetical protein
MIEDLRRAERISVCCRAIVRDRYGLWTGVTHDVAKRGCQIVTSRLLRPGTRVHLALSSDLFPEELEVVAEVVWVAPERLGMAFLESRRRGGALSPSAWIDRMLLHGAQADYAATHRVVPCVRRAERVGTAPPTARAPDASRPLPPRRPLEPGVPGSPG